MTVNATVDWSALRTPGTASAGGEGLRARKKRQTRQLLADTATRMFLERGFDAVRVKEIAEACGVSEKTAFNYFPTKEALLLDRWESTSGALRAVLADPGLPPLRAVLRLLEDELSLLISWFAAQPDFRQAAAAYRAFGALVHSTPSLVAYQRAIGERLAAEAAEALADRIGAGTARPTDPEPVIAATALVGLWRVQALSLNAHVAKAASPERLAEAVEADVNRAAALLGVGLDGFGAV